MKSFALILLAAVAIAAVSLVGMLGYCAFSSAGICNPVHYAASGVGCIGTTVKLIQWATE